MKLVKKNEIVGVEFENGICVVNSTPHPVTMQDAISEELVTVPCSGVLINGTPKTEPVGEEGLFVRTVFEGNDEGRALIDKIKALFSGDYTLVIIGSIIAAQAYPGDVAGLVPVTGYERVAPSEKRMRSDRFTIF